MSQVISGQLPVDLSRSRARIWTLGLGSIGVVYGDIGTSPLYAFKESLTAARPEARSPTNMVIGVMSLMLWALIIIVTLKYVWLIMRADNHGEGGTLSPDGAGCSARWATISRSSPLLGMVGAALFYGDAIITPAISVLSAVEGLKLVTPAFDPFILPLSLVDHRRTVRRPKPRTARVAAWFGPIMMVWFLALALGGVIHLADDPGILRGLQPDPRRRASC